MPPILAAQEGLATGGLGAPIAIVIFVISVLLYALTNSIEISIIGADRIRVRHLAERGDRRAQAIVRLRAGRDRFFAGIVLLQNLFVVVAAAMGSIIAVDIFGSFGLLLGTVVTTVILALFGELTPKVLAAQSKEGYALFVARPAEALIVVLSPVVALISVLPRVLGRALFGKAGEATPTVTEAELRMLIEVGTTEQAIGERTGELLESVFEFRDRQVQEIMVPRTEVSWLETGTTIGDFLDLFQETFHSRFPVYKETIDNVVGVVGIKDVLLGIASGEIDRDSPIESRLRSTYFIPETKTVGSLFWEMQSTNQHMAVVVDEYGGTAGILTIELLMEEMVGPVFEQLAHQPPEFESIDEHTASVDGGMSVSDANDELGLSIPEGRYETVAGYILERLGHIPQEGEPVEGDGFTMVIAEMKGTKIERVLVTKK